MQRRYTVEIAENGIIVKPVPMGKNHGPTVFATLTQFNRWIREKAEAVWGEDPDAKPIAKP